MAPTLIWLCYGAFAIVLALSIVLALKRGRWLGEWGLITRRDQEPGWFAACIALNLVVLGVVIAVGIRQARIDPSWGHARAAAVGGARR